MSPVRVPALLSLIALCGSASSALAVTVPYTNHFDASASDFTFASQSGSPWSLDAANGQLDFAYPNATTGDTFKSASATVEVSNLGGASNADFVMTTDVSFSSNNDQASTVGFAALSATADPTDYFLADIRQDGGMRIYNSDGATTLVSLDRASLQLNTLYTLTLAGTYQPDGKLILSFSIEGDADPTTITTGAISNPNDGHYFGLRNRKAGSAIVGAYESFSIVPEPASLALLGLGGGLMIGRRGHAVANSG